MIESILFGLAGIIGFILIILTISYYKEWMNYLHERRETKKEKKAAQQQKHKEQSIRNEQGSALSLERRFIFEEETELRENGSGYSTKTRTPVI